MMANLVYFLGPSSVFAQKRRLRRQAKRLGGSGGLMMNDDQR